MPGPDWTEEEKAVLRRLWPERNVSINQIAAALPGRSRNSIAGMRMRLGLDPGKSPVPPPGSRKPRGEQSRQQASTDDFDAGVVGSTRLSGVTGPGPGKGMADARWRRDCAWPLWKHTERPTFRVCGHPVQEGHQYCPSHVEASRRKPVMLTSRPWTKPESDKALTLVVSGVPWPKIANLIGRPPAEIKAYAEERGVEYGAGKKGAAA